MSGKRLIGVVADDVTGAGDIGIMYAKAGYTALVFGYRADEPPDYGGERPDVIVLDTDSRFDSPEQAYRKVYGATEQLKRAGCTHYVNKSCSVGRGNIGAEFDAMLDSLGETNAVVVFGFPANGRQTLGGVHYVHGKKLEESEFRRDPVHPMTRSDLVGILQPQTRRKAVSIGIDTVDRGAEALRREIAALKPSTGYLFVDVRDQASLRTIAEAVRDERVTAGASALSEELALAWGAKPDGLCGGSGVPPRPGLGIVMAAGSLMPQTAAQLDALRRAGRTAMLELDALRLFADGEREAEIARVADAMAAAVLAGRDALAQAPNAPEVVARTKAEGARRGLDGVAVSRLVSGAVAETIGRVLAATGQNRLVVAGGDTSAAVCARLGIRGMRVYREIAPGLPSCVSLGPNPLLLVLKSGSFGREDFLAAAAEHVRLV
ncbi:four-carbon acid sugar kinase family protein [Paenibacillus cymbidii]|uniref:four-carbon acid sugar kinase family protein n=1 Tax=Paenibacillus cymbidii TaxID=1639034 RepID=UPI0010821DCE|nr:four-carbon acid sugar kinase family protein [Paenibacillus cymbidii]